MALSAVICNCFNRYLGPGSAAQIVSAINNQSLVGVELGSRLDKMMRGIGEAKAFKTAISGSGTLTDAQMNILERKLEGRGNAEAFKLVVAAGTGA
jgi:hypothetical protein